MRIHSRKGASTNHSIEHDTDLTSLDKRARELWETQGNKQKVNTNRRQACTLWKKAAENGDLAAQYTIATFQLNGNAIEYGILKDVKSALKTLHSLAEKHQHALANYSLGMVYASGLSGVPRDFDRALSFFKRATDYGVADAPYSVYLLLMSQTPPQEKEALEYLFRAVNEHKHLMATFTLATRYNEGRGVPLNRGKAFQLFLETAQHGLALAQHSVGVAYYQGLGCPVDERKALFYFMEAANQGFVPSMRNLAEIYRQGKGRVSADPASAGVYYLLTSLLGTNEERVGIREALTTLPDPRYLLRFDYQCKLGLHNAESNNKPSTKRTSN